ncbi:hypothetical protein H6F32_09305 [Anabaena sp. FACHB-1237]|uniref:hypothetical protein n=1 Tax=Anabaena sp. FACHB-1237 TaxID=2692769 RepID=UPI00168117B3|nr:hypothetical protein [Anabaena sp. FACHB-1237]MBD2137782.1 hypothetical protein [Anabaena sp. FACHB-1237]
MEIAKLLEELSDLTGTDICGGLHPGELPPPDSLPPGSAILLPPVITHIPHPGVSHGIIT